MSELQVDPVIFFVVLEMVIVLMAVAAAFVVRAKILAGRVAGLQSELKKAQDVEIPEPVTLVQYLRDEVLRNQELIDRAAAGGDETDKQAAEVLKIRKQFLEMEIDAREAEKNPVEFQSRIAAGMHTLIEQLRPAPETVTETVTKEVIEEVPEEAATDDASNDTERKHIDTKDAEFARLRDVINNQQDAMAALREQLKAREAEIEDFDSVMAKLDEFERHDAELQQCLSLLEAENRRLKEAPKGSIEVTSMEKGRLDSLQNMLHGQRDTITNLQTLIQELAPEASKAKELQDALGDMEKANKELNGCVAVLEDENAMLRAELEAVAQQLEAQEAEMADRSAAAADSGEETETEVTTADDTDEALLIDDEPDVVALDDSEATAGDDEIQQLEIKVQELEALVEFKDAAIEELEKQYSTLESKYLAATGENKVD